MCTGFPLTSQFAGVCRKVALVSASFSPDVLRVRVNDYRRRCKCCNSVVLRLGLLTVTAFTSVAATIVIVRKEILYVNINYFFHI